MSYEIKLMKIKHVFTVKITHILIAFIVIILCSCNNSKKDGSKKDESKKNIIVGDKKTVEFYFNFPDTIHINKFYNGKIVYKSAFDTIITSFENDLNSPKSRYIIFSYVKTKI